MGISSSNRDWFNLYWWRKGMQTLKHLLTEKLRSHNHLPPFHAMELLAFPNSSRYGAPTITHYHTCRGVVSSLCDINSLIWRVGAGQRLGIIQQEGLGRVQEQLWGWTEVAGKRQMAAGVKPSVVWIKSLARSRKCSHFSESFTSTANEVATLKILLILLIFQRHPSEQQLLSQGAPEERWAEHACGLRGAQWCSQPALASCKYQPV